MGSGLCGMWLHHLRQSDANDGQRPHQAVPRRLTLVCRGRPPGAVNPACCCLKKVEATRVPLQWCKRKAEFESRTFWCVDRWVVKMDPMAYPPATGGGLLPPLASSRGKPENGQLF